MSSTHAPHSDAVLRSLFRLYLARFQLISNMNTGQSPNLGELSKALDQSLTGKAFCVNNRFSIVFIVYAISCVFEANLAKRC
jgi:hypothetical protein